MMIPRTATFVVAMSLASCSQPTPPAETANTPPATSPASAPEAANPTIAPPDRASAVASAPMATQSGPQGSQWDLTKATVTGNLLTVQFQVKPAPDKNLFFIDQKIEDVSVVDDSTSQRYSVLRDDTGKPMASPVAPTGRVLRLDINRGSQAAVWFKFPAPPAGSATVSINIPDVGPFDGVTVHR
ncbi:MULTISPECIES: hypothetical protein [unclassified Lysobacter]|uniref:hypothetical protein n=1 Tax=unclassified Lysobacter TaxID=2635362 RepID=UPI001BEA713F|nr:MULTISPECIES: hypothetical protein [unclassified Lysobacter]MBT2748739.1 hypothetical protein [Lysobacter sp. ISL-42]MBT2751674.1 hypothetical protein [Lysobacter sp. ISL-50]MBT2775868.1 hypothetical protein [Lysobacter sp. ISL-54]MBT2782168.1 hypothetical protein [Lysobacter sp. ISL-52]